MADISYDAAERTYILPLTDENLNRVRNMRNVVEIAKYEAEGADPNVFPHDPDHYAWNADNYGPIWVPAKGATVQLTPENLPLYRRIIEIYEGNKLEVKNGVIYINDQPAKEYTFKMDYYFMMGDNRHNSADSRFGDLCRKTTLWEKPQWCSSLQTKKNHSRKISAGIGCLRELNNN